MIKRLFTLYRFSEKAKIWVDNRFTRLGKVFLFALMVSAVFGSSVQSSMIYQIFTILFFLLLISFLTRIYFLPDLEIVRKHPETCIAGEEFSYHLMIKNSGKKIWRGLLFREAVTTTIPTYNEFSTIRELGEEKRNYYDQKMMYYRWLWLLKMLKRIDKKEQFLPDLPAQSSTDVAVKLLPLRRGNVHFPGYHITRIDPFGLCKKMNFYHDPRNLLVLPKLYRHAPLVFEGSRKYHQGGISSAQELGDSNEFLTLREYVPGDPVRHIDWKSTARSGQTVVKKYTDEYFSRYGLVLDSFTPNQFSDIFETAVSISASFLMSQDSVNSVLDLLFVEEECVISTAGRGVADLERMLKILAQISPCSDKPFSALSSLVMEHCSLLTGIILVLLDIDDDRKELITYLDAHKVPLKVIVLSDCRETTEESAEKFRVAGFIKIIDINKSIEEQLAVI